MLEELKEANGYVTGKIKEKDELILELEKFAEENNVPIVTKEVAEYLKFMVDINKSENILEVGTAIGYSGILMARVCKKYNGKLTTIEIDETRYNEALENFKKAGLNNVRAILGDAEEEIKKLNEEFDFVFIDASKGHYKQFFEDSYKLLNSNIYYFLTSAIKILYL